MESAINLFFVGKVNEIIASTDKRMKLIARMNYSTTGDAWLRDKLYIWEHLDNRPIVLDLE